MKNGSTSRLGSKQLSDLLSIGDDVSKPRNMEPADQLLEQMFREWLGRELPLQGGSVPSAKVLPGRSCEEVSNFHGGTIGALLLDPEADLTAIAYLKDYAKESAKTEDDGSSREIATALYYAAIASALVFHGKKITGLSKHELDISFSALAETPWITPDIVELFKTAQIICKQ